MTQHEGAAARGLDERGEVLDLALDRVGRCVRAVAAAATVVGDDRQVFGQAWSEFPDGAAIGQRTTHDDERRPAPAPVERNGRAVPGSNGFHLRTVPSRARAALRFWATDRYERLSTDRMLPAGSRNHAIDGPLPRAMPLASVFIDSVS